jgi:alkyl hydroperoxide reductase subunit AhpC
LRQQEERIRKLDLRISVITFDTDFMALAYIKKVNLPWPLLSDPDQKLYAAYGMVRGNWWSIYGLPSIIKYLSLIARGRFPGKPGKDWRQLGGDILIDPEGIVRVHHISTGPHDRPTVESLLALIESRRR